MIDADALSAFLAFAEHRNFTRAAQDLSISQPALHVKIKKLGNSLGVPLYRRVGRRLELTQHGRRVQAFARERTERDRQFLDELRQGWSEEPVVLAAGEGAYLYLLGEVIQEIAALERTSLRLLTRDRDGAAEAVRSGEAHLAVAALEGAPDGVRIEPWLEVPMVLAMPKGHELARKRTLRLQDLQGRRLIVPPSGRPHRTTLERSLLNARVEWEPSVEAGGWELMMHFCALGLGLAIVNGCCRLPSSLTAKPLPEIPSIPFFLMFRYGAYVSPATERIAAILHEKKPSRSQSLS